MNDIEILKTGTWFNPPSTWNMSERALTLETDAKTDFWRDTLYGFRRDSGHALLVPVVEDFTAYLTFTGAYDTLYDQAGLLLRRDEGLWLKAGIEYSDGISNMSVVVTDGASDWSTVALPDAAGPQRLRLTRLGDAVVIQFRNLANHWQLLRVAGFPAAGSLHIGPMACSPERKGFKAEFSEFSISPPVRQALHDTSPAS